MKKLQTLLIGLIVALLISGTAFADVISGPAYAFILGAPLIGAAVLIIAAVLVIRAVARNAKKNKDAENANDMTCRHSDAEADARKSSWDNRDPWD